MPREAWAVIDNRGRVISEQFMETDRYPDYKALGKVVADIYRKEQAAKAESA